MNKKNVVTAKNIAKVADFLKEACDYFKKQGEGCYRFILSDDLALYVGWSDGYNMADTDIIKSVKGQRDNGGSWVCGYAVNAGIKVRNDYDWCDYDYLNFPVYTDEFCPEVCDTGISMKPNQSRREYRKDARWFLENFVNMTNDLKQGNLRLE